MARSFGGGQDTIYGRVRSCLARTTCSRRGGGRSAACHIVTARCLGRFSGLSWAQLGLRGLCPRLSRRHYLLSGQGMAAYTFGLWGFGCRLWPRFGQRSGDFARNSCVVLSFDRPISPALSVAFMLLALGNHLGEPKRPTAGMGRATLVALGGQARRFPEQFYDLWTGRDVGVGKRLTPPLAGFMGVRHKILWMVSKSNCRAKRNPSP